MFRSESTSFPANSWMDQLLTTNKFKVPVWTTLPKSPNPIIYEDAILWARQLGEAAKIGYEVVFRQPRLRELYSETPVRIISIYIYF